MLILLSNETKNDLKNIKEFISLENKAAAIKVIQRITRHINKNLSDNPYMGRIYKNDIRELLIPNLSYSAIYRIREDHIQVLRVLHQRRDFSKLFN